IRRVRSHRDVRRQPAGPHPDHAFGRVRGAGERPGPRRRHQPGDGAGLSRCAGGAARPADGAVVSTLQAKVGVRRPDGFTLEVDLDAPAGTTTALLGPNGAGKSTVVSAIAGLLPIDDGRIALDGTVWDVPREGV